MSGNFLKWGIPAFVTVIGGTYAAVAMSGSAIPADLAVRASLALDAPEFGWVDLKVDMQDVTIGGTAPSAELLQAAVQRVAEVQGVMNVDSRATVAAPLSPYPFVISVENGQLTLSGAVPDDSVREAILKLAGKEVTDHLEVAPGAGDASAWVAAVTFALKAARRLQSGEVALADLSLTLSGEARTPDDYAALANLSEGATPAGVTLGFHEVTPAAVAPFALDLAYDQQHLLLTGYVPDKKVLQSLVTVLPSGVELIDKTQVASGAPADFEARLTLIAKAVVGLAQGKASLSGETSRLSGTPRDPAQRREVIALLAKDAVSLDFSPPEHVDWSLTIKSNDGKLSLDGTLPVALRRSMSEQPGVDLGNLDYEDVADPGLAAPVAFALQIAAQLHTGEVRFSDGRLQLEGIALSPEAYKKVQQELKGLPAGLSLAKADLHPATVSPYVFELSRTADGLFATGFAPDEAMLSSLEESKANVNGMAVAEGAPTGFAADLRAALALLAKVESGKIGFDGKVWSGQLSAKDPMQAIALKSAIAEAKLDNGRGQVDIVLPKPAPVAELPAVADYTWTLSKSEAGSYSASGYAPAEAFKQVLAVHLGRIADATTLAKGAPATFTADALKAADAIAAMTSGSASFSNGKWLISGKVSKGEERAVIAAALGEARSPQWTLEIAAADDLPKADPFLWSALKSDDGQVHLTGVVPSDAVKKHLAEVLGRGVTDTTTLATGAPTDFEGNLDLALKIAHTLKAGRIAFDGKQWVVDGSADTEDAAASVQSLVASSPSWTVRVSAPPKTVVEAQGTDESAGAPDQQPVPVADEPTEASAATDFDPPAEQKVAALPADSGVDTQASSVDLSVPFRFAMHKQKGGKTALEGIVPDAAEKSAIEATLKLKDGSPLAVGSGLPTDFPQETQTALAALNLLTDGVVGLQGDKWVVSGRVRDPATLASLRTLLASTGSTPWAADLKTLPERELCADVLQSLAARNAIVFEAGSAVLTKPSSAAIDELAADLALCPKTAINVEGHTDADGDPDANLALSVARAEAVVDQLVQRGIGPDRLYAVGYGASVPIASNDTKAGKQANRRIAFSLADE